MSTFLADECVARAIVRGLIERGLDVVDAKASSRWRRRPDAPEPARLPQTCREAQASRERSKIRLVRCWDRCFLSGIVFMRVLGADNFRPAARGAQISYGGRPGHREDAFILDRELEPKLRSNRPGSASASRATTDEAWLGACVTAYTNYGGRT